MKSKPYSTVVCFNNGFNTSSNGKGIAMNTTAGKFHSPLLIDKFYSTHPGAPHQICRAHFDYIAFRSSADIMSGRRSLEEG
jgi:hypothetical protein